MCLCLFTVLCMWMGQHLCPLSFFIFPSIANYNFEVYPLFNYRILFLFQELWLMIKKTQLCLTKFHYLISREVPVSPSPPARIHKNSVLKQFHMNACLSLVFSTAGNYLFEKQNAMLNMHFSLKCDLFSGWYLCSTFN